MGRCIAIALALVACGRIDFDPLDGGSSARCTFTSVSIGEATTCALDSRGRVYCWGANHDGQTGMPASPEPVLAAARVVLRDAAVEVGVGKSFGCARLGDGSIWCWGDNSWGQHGNGATAPAAVPTQVALGGETALELEVAGAYACTRRASDSAVMCWGQNRFLVLGDTGAPADERMPQPTPVVIPGTAGTKQFVLGHRHGCGFDAADQIYCWGKGVEGQLGVGTNANSAMPVRPGGLAAVQAIDAANRLTCVALAGGGVQCWGTRYLGGASFDFYQPTVLVPDGIEVATSNYGGCAVRADTSVSCWGYLYDQRPTPIDNTPTPLDLTGIASIEGGWYHYCAFTTSGDLVCWGSDDKGQLGRGEVESDPRPAPVAQLCD
ncbi:MAG TPA: hypothetical protein VIV11_07750 [Kofleriaceae bacterium]